jgi:membrane fusion protein (multidrug efflux system)
MNSYYHSCRVWALGIISLAGIYSCTNNASTKNSTKEIYKVISPVKIDTHYYNEYAADLHAVQYVEIRSHIRGFIEKIHVDEGASVTAGQLLFTIDNRILKQEIEKLQAQLGMAEAELKQAQIEVNSTKPLVDKKIISEVELELKRSKVTIAEAKIKEVKADLALAKVNLDYSEIRAPFSGTINRIPNKKGSLVDEGVILTTLSSTNDVFAYFKVSEAEYLYFQKRKQAGNYDEVELILADNSKYELTGRIETTETEFDQASGNIAFRARFNNPKGLLKNGSNGKVRIKENVSNALIIPQRSTFEIQDKIFVFVADKKGKVTQREVVIAERLPHAYLIKEGISTEEKIILEGVASLKNGDDVQINTLTADETLKQINPTEK